MKLNSKRIKEELRKDRRSIAWLADELGMEYQTLWDQIKGQNPKSIDKIAKALGVKPVTLILWEV